MPILGPDHQEYDKITIIPGTNTQSVLGIFPGKERNYKAKKNKNEDIIAQIERQNIGKISILADAHLGKNTAEAIVELFPDILERELKRTSNIKKALFASIIVLNAKIWSNKMMENNYFQNNTSASTCLIALERGDELYYISVGDSYIYLIDEEGKATHINEKQIREVEPIFIGESQHEYFEEYIYKKVKEYHEEKNDFQKEKYDWILNPFGQEIGDYDLLKPYIDIGSFPLEALENKTLLLTTDGIEEGIIHIKMEDLISQHRDLLQKALQRPSPYLEHFMQALLETIQNKETNSASDNISIIVQSF